MNRASPLPPMGRKRHRRTRRSENLSSRNDPGREDSGTPSGWIPAKRPVMRFILVFGAFLAAFYAISLTPFAENRLWPAYLEINAQISGAVLRALGETAHVDHRAIFSSRALVLIERGCDAIHPSALFVAAVLASPVPWLAKLPGILLGTLALMVINLFRIVSLFYVKIHFPAAFEVMHVEVWQAVFIFLAVFLWALWAVWALRGKLTPSDVPND